MYNTKIALLFVSMSAVACGSSYPVPTQRMADAQSASRSARELGAEKQPKAALHLKLAEEQTALANNKLKEEDYKRADFLLVRAKADAELAVALANEEKASNDVKEAVEKAKTQSQLNNSTPTNNSIPGVAR